MSFENMMNDASSRGEIALGVLTTEGVSLKSVR